ncbi:MAG: cytochrome C peroxidase [Saprospiraceae bacterium]|nr:cytochrome C peroxidase [Saprospiraceae bacterium]
MRFFHKWIAACIALIWLILVFAFDMVRTPSERHYSKQILQMREQLNTTREQLDSLDAGLAIHRIHTARIALKKIDFWLRYLEPISYKLINGPLPLEWETEVFEKFEKPYARYGGGLTLAENYLEEEEFSADSLHHLLDTALKTCDVFWHDSIRVFLRTPDAFFYAQRLFLLNLAAIYTTGFECPDTSRIIPELKILCNSVAEIHEAHNVSFPEFSLTDSFNLVYRSMLVWLSQQSDVWSKFSHFMFIRDYVEPLFGLNQRMIQKYRMRSFSFNDYSLSKKAVSIFDKRLYEAQDDMGVFRPARLEEQKREIIALGKLLFYDPIFSSNNQRACASCHVPSMFFTDTTVQSALKFDRRSRLERNTPSLLGSIHQHLLMHDGRHFNLVKQMKEVVSNPEELKEDTLRLVRKIMSIPEYALKLKSVASFTSIKKPSFEHLTGAISMYLGQFVYENSAFDRMIRNEEKPDELAVQGFNLFMGKAQCGTCHFPPQFGGVKPPYVGSEFEVLGVPADTSFQSVSRDSGRYHFHPSKETFRAFRTPTVRNSHLTKPYMHNGVFWSLEEVVDFYNNGGGQGRGLILDNQTLSSDSLKLTRSEMNALIHFMQTLDEKIETGVPPDALPLSKNKKYQHRKVGGEY